MARQKHCLSCDEIKPNTLEFFPRSRGRKLRNECRKCRNAYRAKKHEEYSRDPAYKQRKAKASSAYYYANRDRVIRKNRRRTRLAAIKAARYARDQKRRLVDAEFVRINKERCRSWYLANKQRHMKYTRRWRRKNTEAYQRMSTAQNAARRARLLGAPGRYSARDIRDILERQGHRCFWCDCDISRGKHTIDHYMPLSRGGSNWPDNIVCACASCNGRKWARHPLEFARMIGRQIQV